MSTQTEAATEVAPTKAAKRRRRPTTQRHLFDALVFLSTALRHEFDDATLDYVLQSIPDQLEGMRRRLIVAIESVAGAGPGGTAVAPTIVPVDEQMNRIVKWQRARSIYFHRSEKEMASLRARLLEMPVGTEAIPAYANSVQVREPSGRVYLMNYSGYEVVQ